MQRGSEDIKKVLKVLRAMIHFKVHQMVLDDGMEKDEAKLLVAEKTGVKNWNTLMSNINANIAKGHIKFRRLDRIAESLGITRSELCRKAGVK